MNQQTACQLFSKLVLPVHLIGEPDVRAAAAMRHLPFVDSGGEQLLLYCYTGLAVYEPHHRSRIATGIIYIYI